MSARGTRPRAARPAGTGARTPTASPPGARPADPCRSGPALARLQSRPSAARATTIDPGMTWAGVAPSPDRRHQPQEATMNSLNSHDGTTIAYDTQGEGPALILVDGALTVHSSGSGELA